MKTQNQNSTKTHHKFRYHLPSTHETAFVDPLNLQKMERNFTKQKYHQQEHIKPIN